MYIEMIMLRSRGVIDMLEVIFTNDKPQNVVKVIAMFEGQETAIDFLTANEIKLVESAILQSGFEGKSNQICVVYGAREKIILFGLGKKNDILAIRDAGQFLFENLFDVECAYIAVESEDIALNLAYGVLLGSYSFDKYKTEKKAEEYTKLERIILRVENEKEATEHFKPYVAMVNGVRYCKDLCNEPASYLTPEVFASDIKRLTYLGLDIDVLDSEQIRLNGLGLIDAVGKGSDNKPYVVVMRWIGNRDKKDYDLGLIGKGVCFDAGGLSLKSNQGMIEMKMDMAGAAAVVASMKVAALQRVRKNLVAVVGLVENIPSATAMKIGDVYTSFKGKTVEVVNADAEGRLVVADCLSYLQNNYKVSRLVDIATFGSLKTTLGNVYAAVFSNDEELVEDLIESGNLSGEKLWQMPLDNRYKKMLSSKIADLKNLPVGESASVASSAFLQEFIEKDTKWAHIDMSGLRLNKDGLASGFGVKLLNEFIKGL